MATIHQIDANRLNAQKSTGRRSCQNALKSGIDTESEIIPGEKPTSLEELIAEYIDHFQPTTPEERLYVDTLVRDDWQLRRFAKVDAQFWEFPVGDAVQTASRYFERLQRRIHATERSYQRSLRELERLRWIRKLDSQPPAQPLLVPYPAIC